MGNRRTVCLIVGILIAACIICYVYYKNRKIRNVEEGFKTGNCKLCTQCKKGKQCNIKKKCKKCICNRCKFFLKSKIRKRLNRFIDTLTR